MVPGKIKTVRPILLLVLSTFLLALPPSAAASDQFKTVIDVTYRFDETGRSEVTHQVTLTNRYSLTMATSYTLSLRGEDPQNITARDASGPLEITSVTKDPDITQIAVEFTKPAAGRGQSYSFILSYAGKPAVRKGQVWEIYLPRLSDPDFADDYHLQLLIPAGFGLPAYITPPPDTPGQPQAIAGQSYSRYSFSQNSQAKGGIIAAFGDFQTYDFSLDYHLKNPSFFAKNLVVALPPDTSYQRVFYDSLTPLPQNVSVDPDGNWLASFRVPGRSDLLVTARGQTHLLGEPTSPPASPSAQTLNKYLAPTSHWPTRNPRIQELAKNLTTPQAIYDYVVSTLSYDYSRVSPDTTRQGALWALDHPNQAICTDFTDLFITLARSAGIPAREIQGYAVSDDPRLKPLGLVTDVLHAWPEYWDTTVKSWRWVDPTWGKTSGGVDFFSRIDLSHFAFAVHGSDPVLPLPAGLYKQGPATKDVRISLAPYKDYFSAPLDTRWDQPFQFLPFITNSSRVVIANPNGLALYRLPVTLSAHNLTLAGVPPGEISILPPFSTIAVPVAFRGRAVPELSAKLFAIQVGSHVVTYNIPDRLFLVWYAAISLTLTLTVLFVAVFAVKAWHLYLQKHPR